jgi:hypothetical protein
MEKATFRVQRARLHLLARRHGLAARLTYREAAELFLFPAPSSLRDEAERLNAAAAYQDGEVRHALAHIERAVYLADRRNNRFSLALSLAARATIRRRLGMAGADLDRERAAAGLEAIGAAGCYLLRVEGWHDPAVG